MPCSVDAETRCCGVISGSAAGNRNRCLTGFRDGWSSDARLRRAALRIDRDETAFLSGDQHGGELRGGPFGRHVAGIPIANGTARQAKAIGGKRGRTVLVWSSERRLIPMAILRFPASRPDDSHVSRSTGGEGAAAAGDASFAQMWKELRPGLRKHLLRQLGSVDAAEDAVQETFLRMLRYQVVDNPSERRALLFRVAASVVADCRRNAKSRRANNHCTLDDQELVSDAPQPDRNFVNHQNLVSLQRAILTLPPRCREVFLLHRFEDLSYRDIARRFGTSERTVENQISHALAVCRRALA